MRTLLKTTLTSLALAWSAPTLAQSDDVTSKVVEESDGTRTLIHEAVIDATIDRVWWTLSTEEGWQSWGPKFAKFDLRNGGSIETGYHDNAQIGDDRNIRHRIIAFVPEQMMVLQVEQAPAGGPVDIELLRAMWGIYELEPLGPDRTRLRISGLGYGGDEASSRLLEFFKSGNVYSINLMKQNLAKASKQD